jgi:hypothetical protein
MGVDVFWEDETKTVVRLSFNGEWNWRDYYTAVQQSNAMLESVRHKVHIITDFRDGATLPPQAFIHLRRALFDVPLNWGLSVFVTGDNTPMNSLMQSFVKMHPRLGKRIRIVPSLEDAYTLLNYPDGQWLNG